MYDTETGHAVRDRLVELKDGPGALKESERSQLRDSVCAAVDELKGRGWPAERIIVRLKTLADEVGFLHGRTDEERGREAVVAELVRWCIDQYYDA